jgi:hypothetical protein
LREEGWPTHPGKPKTKGVDSSHGPHGKPKDVKPVLQVAIGVKVYPGVDFIRGRLTIEGILAHLDIDQAQTNTILPLKPASHRLRSADDKRILERTSVRAFHG